MNVLVIGDIVGPEATRYVAERLPQLRREYEVDLVIANGENCAITAPTPWEGFGMTVELVEMLLAAGVDVITSGNHGWDGPEAGTVHSHPRVLRPYNIPSDIPGKGILSVDVAGERVTVLNLGSASAGVPDAEHVYKSWRAAHDRGELPGTVVIDFHGDAAWEKMIFATAVDGSVAAVLGTHTHEPTIHLHVLPGGTGFVADVGMTAPTGSPGGFPLVHFATKFKGEDWSALPPFELSKGPMTLGAVWLRIESGKTVEIKRVS